MNLQTLRRKTRHLNRGKIWIRNILDTSLQSVTHNISTTTKSPSRVPEPRASLRSYATKYFGSNVAKEVDKHCRTVLERIFVNATAPLDDISEMVQTFYQTMKERMANLRPIKADFSLNMFMLNLEEYICTEAYDFIFSDWAGEEAADLSIQDRIRSLNWVTTGFIETAFDFSILAVHNHIDEAVAYIVNLNQYRSPSEKLNCLVNCSKKLLDALRESRSGALASADEFLPALIYTILHANPPLILSNMKFISRFALPSRIITGESGYYFTNLSCALQFIQDMNADSLSMDKEEFEAYTSGRQGVPFNNRESDRNMAIKTMERNLNLLDSLLENQTKLDEKITAFPGKLEENCEKCAVNQLEAFQELCTTIREPDANASTTSVTLEHESDV